MISDSELCRVDEFVSKVVVFAKQYPEFKHNVYSTDVPYQPFNKVINVVFTAPNGKEQVGFLMMIDSVYNPYGEKEFNAELYKTVIDNLNCEFDKILSEKKNVWFGWFKKTSCAVLYWQSI